MNISTNTTTQTAEVITGGTIRLSMADARAIYAMTTLAEDENIRNSNYEQCRILLRNISKSILMVAGDTTKIEDLMKSSLEIDEEYSQSRVSAMKSNTFE